MSSEYKMIHGNKTLIVCFGGMVSSFGGIIPFEFLRYLSSVYTNGCDLVFFIDKNQCWYHKGIQGITNNVDETVVYLNQIIQNGNYTKVIFMGISAGGYAAMLFGSLCNITNVISFIPQTKLKKSLDTKYTDLNDIINHTTKYTLYADTSVTDMNDCHHIYHCEHVQHHTNVNIIKGKHCVLKTLRDTGYIKKLIDSIILDI